MKPSECAPGYWIVKRNGEEQVWLKNTHLKWRGPEFIKQYSNEEMETMGEVLRAASQEESSRYQRVKIHTREGDGESLAIQGSHTGSWLRIGWSCMTSSIVIGFSNENGETSEFGAIEFGNLRALVQHLDSLDKTGSFRIEEKS